MAFARIRNHKNAPLFILLRGLLLILLLLSPIKAQKSPGPRQGHCSFIYLNELYIFGGIMEPNAPLFSKISLPIQSLNDSAWTNLPVDGVENVVRGGCVVTIGGIAVFVGSPLSSPSSANFTGVQTYNISSGVWNSIPQTGFDGFDIKSALNQRCDHSVIIQGHRIIVYGGYVGPASNYTSDTFVLNVYNRHDWTWYQADTSQGPPPTAKTTLTSAQGIIYAFTSSNVSYWDRSGPPNAIYSFDPSQLNWEGLFGGLTTFYPCLQVATFLDQDIFMLPSGLDMDDLPLMINQKDYYFWKLSLDNNSISHLPLNSKSPLPRIRASTSVLNLEYIYMYGGYNGSSLSEMWLYNMSNYTWSFLGPSPIIITTSEAPSPTSSEIPSYSHGSNYLIGIIVGSILGFLLVCIIVGVVFYYAQRHERRVATAAGQGEEGGGGDIENPPEKGDNSHLAVPPASNSGSHSTENSASSTVPPMPEIVQPVLPPSRQSSVSTRFHEYLPEESVPAIPALSVAGPSTFAARDITDEPFGTESYLGDEEEEEEEDSSQPQKNIVFRRSW